MSELPKGWVTATLADVCFRSQYGYTTKSTSIGDVHFLRTTDITSGVIDWDSVPFCLSNPESIDKYRLKDGDIVISRAGSVGFSCLLSNTPKNTVFASYLIRFRPTPPFSNNYLSYFLNSPSYWAQIVKHSVGVAVQNVNAKKLSVVQLPVAPLNEQIRIANKLDSLLGKLETTQEHLDKIPALLKRFRQSVLAAAVSGELTKNWKDKNSDVLKELNLIKASREKSFIKDSETHFKRAEKKLRKYDYSVFGENTPERNIPKDWEVIQLGEIISFLTDYHANGSYKILKKMVKLSDQVDYACMIRATNFEKNNFDDLMIYISKEAYEFLSKSKLYGGEILVGKIGNAGSVYIMPNLDKPASLAMNLFSIRFDEKLVNSKYIYMFLRSNSGENNIQKYVRGVATKSIDKKSLRSVFINYPCLKEQNEIVKRVESLFKLADRVEQQYQTAKQRTDKLTQSILAKAFCGELVLQDPNDEPASELLERIQALRKIEQEANKNTPRKRVVKSKLKKVKPMTLSDAPEAYLSNLLGEMDNKASAENLWNKSEMLIDDFYCQLKAEMETSIIEDKESSDPSMRFLKLANQG